MEEEKAKSEPEMEEHLPQQKVNIDDGFTAEEREKWRRSRPVKQLRLPVREVRGFAKPHSTRG